MVKLTALMVVVGIAGTAWADAPPVDCPRPKKKKVVKRPPPKKPDTPCSCVGKEGPPGPRGPEGPRGPKGDPGENTIVLMELEVERPRLFVPRIGFLGILQAPHGDWAWGPALQLSHEHSKDGRVNLTGGLAMGASEGRETGYILQLAYERSLNRDGNNEISVELGVQYSSIEGSPHNGEIDGRNLSGFVSYVYDIRNLRVALGPTVGGLRDGFEDGTQFSIGVQASAFVEWR